MRTVPLIGFKTTCCMSSIARMIARRSPSAKDECECRANQSSSIGGGVCYRRSMQMARPHHNRNEPNQMERQCYSHSLMHRTLSVIARSGPLNLTEWALLAARHTIPGARGYLLHLHRIGLLNRGRDSVDQPLYSISIRGSERLSSFQSTGRIQPKSRTKAE